MGNIVGSYNSSTGLLTLTSAGSTATLAQWQSALRSVSYNDTSHNPNTGTRTISFVVNDGTLSSTASTRQVSIAATDTAAVVTDAAGTTPWTEASGTGSNTPVVVDSGLTVSDVDNTTLASATVQITGGLQSGEDVLGFTNDGSSMGNIVGSYNSSTGLLTLTSAGSTATLAQWQSALRSVSYNDTSHNPNTGTRTISFVVNDGTLSSTASTRQVSIAATDTAAVVTDAAGTTPWTEASGTGSNTPVVVDSGLTVSDVDNTTLASATVQITGGLQSGEDVLGFTNDGSSMGNIVGSYNSSTGLLTLTSAGTTATLAQWQSALRSVSYNDTSHNPNTGTRTISFVVNDGTLSSTASTRQVSIAATDTAAVVTDAAGTTPWTEASGTGSNTPVVVDS